MTMQLLTNSDTLNRVYEQIRLMLAESKPPICGLILASCTLEDHQLECLEPRIRKANEQPIRYLYERQSGVLAVFCGGMKLSRTHYIALELKQFLLDENRHKGSIMISGISEPGGFGLPDIDAMLERLASEASDDAKIQMYMRRPNGEKQPTVLIIDDDEAGSEFLHNRLQMKGYEVYRAYDGLQGVRLCEKLSPDVVITELTLPVYDGYQVIRKLRQNARVDSKIVVLSERRREQDVSACFEMGVADYVKKPYSPVELEARLRRLLG